MIDWVHSCCQQWSVQYRMREYAGLYPSLSDLRGFNYIHKPEGLTGPAQELSLAVVRMRGTRDMQAPCDILVAHELFAGTVKAKMNQLHIDMDTYYRHLHAAQCFLAARIPQPVPRETFEASSLARSLAAS